MTVEYCNESDSTQSLTSMTRKVVSDLIRGRSPFSVTNSISMSVSARKIMERSQTGWRSFPSGGVADGTLLAANYCCTSLRKTILWRTLTHENANGRIQANIYATRNAFSELHLVRVTSRANSWSTLGRSRNGEKIRTKRVEG